MFNLPCAYFTNILALNVCIFTLLWLCTLKVHPETLYRMKSFVRFDYSLLHCCYGCDDMICENIKTNDQAGKDSQYYEFN